MQVLFYGKTPSGGPGGRFEKGASDMQKYFCDGKIDQQ